MIQINWQLPKSMFSEIDRLLSAMPAHAAALTVDSVNIDEMLAGIDLGGFDTVRKELSDDDLQRLVSRVAVGEALTANGQAVALYIEDRKGQDPNYNYDDLPKVHLVNCGIAFKEGRYVQVVNPDGKFSVIFRGGVRLERELRVCGKCKSSIKAQRRGWVSKFSLQARDGRTIDWAGWNKFIVTQPTSLPKHERVSSYTAAGTRSVDSYGYTADWKQISERRREQVDWRCEDCRVRLNGRDRQFLDGHHRNRNKQDNSESNIVILCRLCHREQGFHWHEGDDHGLLVRDNWLDANRVITVRREEQGIVWRVTPAYKATHRSDGV